MFEWLRRRHRARVLAGATLDMALWHDTLASFPFLARLSNEECERLRQLVILFLNEKSFTGAAGLTVNDAMRLLIAAQACLLILNLDIDYFRGWVEIIVYPGRFVPTHEFTDENGVTHIERVAHAGESWSGGPLILSWADVAPASAEDGINVVIHEFAHKLDMLTGEANGCPPLHSNMSRIVWGRVFTAAYEDFCRRVDADEELIIDDYAAEDPAEFFAVMSEAFFVAPDGVARSYPEIYEQLVLFYRQDPLSRASSRYSRCSEAWKQS